jgi:hypothetical protein
LQASITDNRRSRSELGQPRMQRSHQRYRHEQPRSIGGRQRARGVEQRFQTGDVVHVQVGDEERWRQTPVARLEGGNDTRAAVDQQTRRAGCLQHGRRRQQFGGGAAGAEKT